MYIMPARRGFEGSITPRAPLALATDPAWVRQPCRTRAERSVELRGRRVLPVRRRRWARTHAPGRVGLPPTTSISGCPRPSSSCDDGVHGRHPARPPEAPRPGVSRREPVARVRRAHGSMARTLERTVDSQETHLHRVRRRYDGSSSSGLLLACGRSKRASSALEVHRTTSFADRQDHRAGQCRDREDRARIGRSRPLQAGSFGSWGAYGRGVRHGCGAGQRHGLDQRWGLDLPPLAQIGGASTREADCTGTEQARSAEGHQAPHSSFGDHKSSDKFHLTRRTCSSSTATPATSTMRLRLRQRQGACRQRGHGEEIISQQEDGQGRRAERDGRRASRTAPRARTRHEQRSVRIFGRVLGVFIMGDPGRGAAAKAARRHRGERAREVRHDADRSRVLEVGGPGQSPSRRRGRGDGWYGEGFRVSLVNASDVYGSPVTNAAIGAGQAVAIEGPERQPGGRGRARGQAVAAGSSADFVGSGSRSGAATETPSVEGMRAYAAGRRTPSR